MEIFGFTDLIGSDSKEPYLVKGKISLLPSSDGGRKTGIRANYRPNHNFGTVDGREFYIGQIDFDDVDWIQPGESHIVNIRFIPGPGLDELLVPGRKWFIQEGQQLVGNVEMIERLNETTVRSRSYP